MTITSLHAPEKRAPRRQPPTVRSLLLFGPGMQAFLALSMVPYLHPHPWHQDWVDALGCWILLLIWGLRAGLFTGRVLGWQGAGGYGGGVPEPSDRIRSAGLRTGFLTALICLAALLPVATYAPDWLIPVLPLALTLPVSLAEARILRHLARP